MTLHQTLIQVGVPTEKGYTCCTPPGFRLARHIRVSGVFKVLQLTEQPKYFEIYPKRSVSLPVCLAGQ